jgi:pimeloyl-ACP methyl ester carboxylesterase
VTPAAADGSLVLPAVVADAARHRRVAVAGGHVAVAELGDPAAPAWVVAHGVGSSARFVATAFAGPVLAEGRRLVVYDLRGHGASLPARRPDEHRLAVHVADLDAVVATTRGDVEVVGGISLGGHAAVCAVCRCGAPAMAAAAGGRPPSLRAVLACLPAWTGRAARGTGAHAAVAAQVERVGVAGILTQLRGDASLAGWLRETLLTDYTRHDPASLAAALRALDGGDAPTTAELAALPVPLAVVAWPDDPGHPLAVAEQWVRSAPQAVLRTVAIAELEAGVERLGRRAVAAVS